MRILMLAWEYPPRIVGGLARVVYALAHEKTRQGHEVHVITSDHPNTELYTNDEGVHVHRVKTQSDWTPNFIIAMAKMNVGMIPIAVRLHLEAPFGVIHAHDWMVGDTAWTLKDIFGIPLVTTMHATEVGRMNGIHNDNQRYVDQSEWRLTYSSARVIVNSNQMLGEIQNRWGIPSDKIAVIPNGIDPTKLACTTAVHELRRKHHLHDRPTVLLVGRMVHEKGAHVLIDAVPAILRQVPDALFVIAGTGTFLDDLKSMAWSRGLGEQVRFFGHANDKDLAELYKVAGDRGCLVVPSLYEPFGIVALEGMAAGVPVVTSDRGGLPDINVHMHTGIVTVAENADSLAWGICQLLTNPRLAAHLSQGALEHVSTSYTWRAIAERTLKLYDEAIIAVRR